MLPCLKLTDLGNNVILRSGHDISRGCYEVSCCFELSKSSDHCGVVRSLTEAVPFSFWHLNGLSMKQ